MARDTAKEYPLGLPDEVFARLMRGLGDRQEGIAILRIRNYLGIRPDEAVAHAGISTAHLSRIEHGKRHARQWTLVKLCMLSLSLSDTQTIYILRLAGCSPA